MAAAHGGQVLLSQTTRELLADEEANQPGLALRDLGKQQLKDLDRPVRLYQLVADGLPNRFPRLRGLSPDPSRRARRLLERRRPVLVVGLLMTAALSLGLVLLLGRQAKALSGIDANQVGIVDAKSNRITYEVPVDSAPNAVAARGDQVWVTNTDSHTVNNIDPGTRTVRQTVTVGSEPGGIAIGGGAVWVANALEGRILRIDPSKREPTDRISVGANPRALAYGGGSLWVANADDGSVSRIDPGTDRVLETFPAGAGAGGIAYGDGALWVTSGGGSTVAAALSCASMPRAET
jgi:YVTN family beta-propeller protein